MTPAQSLEAKVTELGSARAAAAHFKVSEPYLSQIRNGHKSMPDWIAMALGFRRTWVKMETNND